MKKIQSELDKIQIPAEVMDRMYKGINQAKREEKVRPVMSRKRKLIGSLAGLVAVGGLFFGSTFVSPAMAEMASKIPYLKEAFLKDVDKDGVKSVMALVREEGLRRGYEVKLMRVGGFFKEEDQDKVMVLLASKDYNEKTKLDAENLTREMLDKKGYYAKSIEVLPFKADLYSSMRRINQINIQHAKDIQTILKDKGFSVDYVGQIASMKKLLVILPESENRVDDVRSIVRDYLTKKYYEDNYLIDIRTNMDEEAKTEKNLHMIFEGLVAKKEAYKVNSFTYSTKNQLVITIETSLEKKDQKLQDQIQKDVSTQIDKVYKKPYTINMVGLEDLKAIGEE